MFTPSDISKVVYVVDESGAAGMLEEMRSKGKAGRPSGLNTRLFLIGSLLSALEGDGMVLTNLYDVLTRRMDFDWQVRLGIRKTIDGPPTFSQDSVDRMSVSIRDAIEFGSDSAPDLDDDVREGRRTALYALIDAMLDVTLLPTDSTYRSIDATNIWAWGRSPRRRGIKALENDAAALEAAGKTDDAANLREVVTRMKEEKSEVAASTSASSTPAPTEPDADGDGHGGEEAASHAVEAVESEDTSARLPHDRDARASGKTAKDGRTEWFYGYTISGLVRVAEPGQVYREEPRLLERLSVTPGGRDLVRASRDVIERAQPSEVERMVLGDKWYSNLKETNWYHFLREAGWNQAVDMRENDQRWTDVRGMRVTAGTPHCPATPDSFEKIAKPWGKKDDFHEQVARRQDWALKLHAEDPIRGTRRYMCPALAGTLRCPLRPASLVLPADRPLVENPPAAGTAPDCCTVKSTVTIAATDPNARARLWQPYHWGTREQTRQMDLRTSVEQYFSRMKDSNGNDMSRGFVRVTGLARVTLAVALQAVATNISELETWAATYGDERSPGHPLLQPRDPFVVLHLPADEAKELEEWRRERAKARGDEAA